MEDYALPLTPEATSELIRRALSLWGMDSCRSNVIRHNENLACRVDCPGMAGASASAPAAESDGKGYLLRICLPKTSAWVGLQQDVDALRSEILWIRDLRRDTGFVLQQPVPSLKGEELEIIRHPLTGTEVPCMLLTWLEGDMFSQKEPDAEDLAREFGRVQAIFHSQAKSWRPPTGFKRLVYDGAMLAQALPDLEQGVAPGIVRTKDLKLAVEASEKIAGLMTKMPRTPDVWGMIHADWVGNLVVLKRDATARTAVAQAPGLHPDSACAPAPKIVPIDFSLSGFGHYLLDIAIGISNLKRHLRGPYLSGYGIPLSDEDKYCVSAFILMMIFVTAAKHVFNPAWQDWFQSRRMPVIAQEHCRQFLRGESFLMDI